MSLAIVMGATSLSLKDIWESFTQYTGTLEQMLIRDVRMPRVLAVVLTGGILGMTGSMIQGVTRNPIAEPSILGISQGATLVVALFYAAGIAVNTRNIMFAALIGAFFTGIVVLYFLSHKANNQSITKILLAGTALSTFFMSLTTVIGLLSNQSQMIGFWVTGGFKNVTWSDFRLVLVVAIVGGGSALALSSKINLLSLGDDVAIGLGVSPGKMRLSTLMLIIPMCAAAVAVGKNIAFVGLIVPQVVRKIVGEDYRKIIPLSFLVGAVLLTYADLAARILLAPYEMPIGIFTALIGVPFFIAIARKERG
ncbi:MAG: FecCD family ABC transporter permease [Cellulosilyticaceae bacterium]